MAPFSGVVGQNRLDTMFIVIAFIYLCVLLIFFLFFKNFKKPWNFKGIWKYLEKGEEYDNNILREKFKTLHEKERNIFKTLMCFKFKVSVIFEWDWL